MPIKAVVFDMDGVLIDSEVIWRRVREVYAAELGRPWHDEDQAAMMGCSTPDWSERMHQRLKITHLSPPQLAVEIIQRVLDAFDRDLPIRPGAAQALQALSERWPLALASGSPRPLMQRAMAITGFHRYFRSMICGDDVAQGKPHPEIYQRTLDALDVPAPLAVGIEDSGNGLRALRAAGMWAIATPCPEFPLAPEVLALAHVTLPSLEGLTPERVASLAIGEREP